MPDGTSRFKCKGKDLLHFMGTSTFSQYTVVADISVVAVQPDAPMDRTCLLGCGITTGYGAATITANVQQGDNVAIFGAGCVGLSVVQGAAARKAGQIIVVGSLRPSSQHQNPRPVSARVLYSRIDSRASPMALLSIFSPFSRYYNFHSI